MESLISQYDLDQAGLLKDINDKIKELPKTPSQTDQAMDKLFTTWDRSNTQKLDYEQLDAAAALEYALEGTTDRLAKEYEDAEKKFEDQTATADDNKTKFTDYE